MPGIDVRRDVVEVAAMRVVLPEAGEIPTVPRAIVTGDGFTLRLPDQVISSAGPQI